MARRAWPFIVLLFVGGCGGSSAAVTPSDAGAEPLDAEEARDAGYAEDGAGVRDAPPRLSPVEDVWGSCKPRSWKKGKTISGPYSPPSYGTQATQVTALPDGRALLGHAVQIYDPRTDTYETLPQPPKERGYRVGSTVTVLGDNKTVLMTGGDGDDGSWGSRAVDLFDLDTKTWRVGAPMAAVRGQHQAFVLRTGEVMALGGGASGDVFPKPFAEIYSPATGKWRDSDVDIIPSNYGGYVSVVELADGRLLVSNAEDTDFLFDPKTESWRQIRGASPGYSRDWTVRFPDGRIFGGGVDSTRCAKLGSAGCYSEFDIVEETWTLRGAAPLSFEGTPWTSIHVHILPCGRLLLIGRTRTRGVDWARQYHLIFDPTGVRWFELSVSIAVLNEYARTTMLPDGTIVAAYGDTETGGATGRVFPLMLTED